MRFSTQINRVAKYAATLAITVVLASQAMAELKASKAEVRKANGDASQMKPGGTSWVKLKAGDLLTQGTTIKTGSDGVVDLFLGANGPSTRINPNSILKIDKLMAEKTDAGTVVDTELDLKAGNVVGQVNKLAAASKYQVKTATGVAGIRGTIYSVYANGMVYVTEGVVEVIYKGVKYTVPAGSAFIPNADGNGGEVVKMTQDAIDKVNRDAKGGDPRQVKNDEDKSTLNLTPEIPLSGGVGTTGR